MKESINRWLNSIFTSMKWNTWAHLKSQFPIQPIISWVYSCYYWKCKKWETFYSWILKTCELHGFALMSNCSCDFQSPFFNIQNFIFVFYLNSSPLQSTLLLNWISKLPKMQFDEIQGIFKHEFKLTLIFQTWFHSKPNGLTLG